VLQRSVRNLSQQLRDGYEETSDELKELMTIFDYIEGEEVEAEDSRKV
jgi:hypothetical protein